MAKALSSGDFCFNQLEFLGKSWLLSDKGAMVRSEMLAFQFFNVYF